MQSTANRTNVGMEKEDLGLTTSIGYQELVGSVQQRATAVSRSHIAGAGIRAAQEIAAEDFGAQLLQTTEKTNCGGTAGEEHDRK